MDGTKIVMKKSLLSTILLFVSLSANSQDVAEVGLAYLNSLPNQKAACLAKVSSLFADESKQAGMLKRKEALSACYKKIVLDVAGKFYPEGHFGKELEQELYQILDRQRHFFEKVTHCPTSKKGCEFYEDYDALSAMVDYLNETIEFMALNVGEGYADFNPESWLKKWDSVVK